VKRESRELLASCPSCLDRTPGIPLLLLNIYYDGRKRRFVKLRITCITCIIALLFSFSLALPQNEEPETPTDVKQTETAQPGQDGPEKEKTEIVPQQPKVEQAPQAEPEKVQPATAPQQPKAEQALPAEPERKSRVPSKVQPQQKAPATVSFFFDDADIFEVVQTIFGDILKANYIIDPQVKGRVNFRTVTPIPKDEVLKVVEIIFRLNGIGYVEEGGLYRIIPLADVSKELVYSQIGKTPDKVAIEMFTFKNMDLKESMPDIENALGLQLNGGTVRLVPVERMNALIVVASSREQLDYIRQWIGVFDSMYGIARPKIYVYALQNSKAEHIASLLQSILSGGGGGSTPTPTSAPRVEQPKIPVPGQTGTTTPATAAPRAGAAATATSSGTFVSRETKVFADEITNSLVILAIPSDYTFIEETIKKIDIQPRQVVIEMLLARVDLVDNLSFGFAWSFKSDLNFKIFGKDIDLAGNALNNPGGLNTENIPTTGFTFIGTDPSDIVRVRLTAALKDSKAKILAAPHILVSDNREARIQVGSQIPLATSTTTSPLSSGVAVTNTTTSTIQYKDIGIILKVKPQINDSGLVSLELTQEVSQQGDDVNIAGEAFASILKTEATTNLVAQDGQTIVIGGLIREDITKSKDGVPFLSSIPIVGNLFSSTVDNSTRTELIILLTPRVVKNMADVEKVTDGFIRQYKDTTKDEDVRAFIKEKRLQKGVNPPAAEGADK
jgi:type II secretion system protein D